MNIRMRASLFGAVCGVFAILCFSGISAASTPPAAVISEDALSFGNQLIGTTSAAKKVAVTNTGGSPLTINGITLGGANPAQFSKTTTCGATLASGATCTVSVKFAPTSTGEKNATLNVNLAAPAVSRTVTLSGTGTKPTLTVTPLTIAFGDRLVSTTSATHAVTVRNTGTAKMTINGITLGGANPVQFSKTTTCGATLASGATCTVNVRFAPTTAGAKSATLNVNVAAPAVSRTVTLSGTGTKPTLTVTPLTVAFGNQQRNTTSADHPVTVRNTGTANMTINGITLGGANPVQFIKTTTCGATLASGATCTVNVRFAPTTVGAKSATLNVNVAAPATSQAVTLTGTGTSAALPSAPTGVIAFAGIGMVSITWEAVADATSYNIYWSSSPGVTKANGTKISNIETSSYKHKNLPNGLTYYYRVTAVNGAGESVLSTEVSSHIPRIVKTSTFNTAGMLTGYTTYEYDEDARLKKVSAYGATGILSNYVTYEYDAEGHVTKVSTYDFADQLLGYITTEYNAEGKVVKTTTFGPTGLIMQYTTTEYNDAGKPSRVSTYGATGILSQYSTYEYTYEFHEEGDVTRVSNFNFAGFLMGYTTTEYNAEGKKATVTTYGPTGLLSKSTTYEYNDAGRVVKVSNYNLTGLTDYTTTEYDEDGNPVKTSNYDFADLLTGYTMTEFNGVGMPLDISAYGPTGLLQLRTTFEYE